MRSRVRRPKREKRAELGGIRRGAQVAYVRHFQVGSRRVTLTACGHNKKVPLLLIATYGSMLPGPQHTKTWQVIKADGSYEYLKLTTPQPMVHSLYRSWMNIVDVHNKLRQGVASMADIWHTTTWQERHFAEGLGFWEVNVYKALVHFYSRHKSLGHGEFRKRLAWAFLTLGKAPYPGDAGSSSSDTADINASSSQAGQMRTAMPPLRHCEHEYARHPRESKMHRCAYCGKPSYYKCVTCETNGLGLISICGPKACKTRDCRQRHVNGEMIKHATFVMRDESKIKFVQMFANKRKGRSAENESNDNDDE